MPMTSVDTTLMSCSWPCQRRDGGMNGTGSFNLEVSNMRKSFGPNKVLKGINLTIREGEFVGLIGPNGAGKSTLIKILAGVYQASSGEIRLGGRVVRSLAESPEVGFIHQDLALVDGLSIVENLCLGTPPKRRIGPLLNKGAERRGAEQALNRVGLDLPVDVLLSDLTPAEKTLVAVARAMDRGARILVIDEATSTLSPADAARVVGSVAVTVRSGCTVIMVTHKLSEVLNATSRVLAIIDGELVSDQPTKGLDREALVQMLMQQEADARAGVPFPEAGAGEGLLELRDVRRGRVGPINLRLDAGQVIGLSGLIGSGLHDIAFLVNGTLKPDSGEVVMMRRGLTRAMVPPHRESQGGFAELGIRENMSISALPRWRRLVSLIDRRRETYDCEEVADGLSVRPSYLETPFDVLSGGNKQKVILGRAMLRRPDVFVLCEPTRGVDVGTRSEIYRLIRELARAGAAVLVASSDAEDLFAVCDLVALVFDGRVEPLRPFSELTSSQLESLV
jgi:ribose transport system ATP-binding protein